MSSDRRLYPRLRFNIIMLIYLPNGVEYNVQVTDISENGIAFSMLLRDYMESKLKSNSQVKFLFVDKQNSYKPFIQSKCTIKNVEINGAHARLGAFVNDETYSKYVSIKKTMP